MRQVQQLIGFLSLSLVCVSTAFSASLSYTANDLLTSKSIAFPKTNANATVIVFLSAKCPCSGGHEPYLKTLYEKFSGPSSGVEFIGVHSNQDEAKDTSVEHFKAAALPFPVVQDEGAKIADQLKALKTPHVFIVKKAKSYFKAESTIRPAPRLQKSIF